MMVMIVIRWMVDVWVLWSWPTLVAGLTARIARRLEPGLGLGIDLELTHASGHGVADDRAAG